MPSQSILKEHFLSAPRNAQYTSHMIQNDIIALIGKYIIMQKTILNETRPGHKLFAVTAMNVEIVLITKNKINVISQI